jgi:hypothetical protein
MVGMPDYIAPEVFMMRGYSKGCDSLSDDSNATQADISGVDPTPFFTLPPPSFFFLFRAQDSVHIPYDTLLRALHSTSSVPQHFQKRI